MTFKNIYESPLNNINKIPIFTNNYKYSKKRRSIGNNYTIGNTNLRSKYKQYIIEQNQRKNTLIKEKKSMSWRPNLRYKYRSVRKNKIEHNKIKNKIMENIIFTKLNGDNISLYDICLEYSKKTKSCLKNTINFSNLLKKHFKSNMIISHAVLNKLVIYQHGETNTKEYPNIIKKQKLIFNTNNINENNLLNKLKMGNTLTITLVYP